MKLFINKIKGVAVVHLRARAEGPGGMVGDMFHDVHPGEDYNGYTYVKLAAAGGVLDTKKTKPTREN